MTAELYAVSNFHGAANLRTLAQKHQNQPKIMMTLKQKLEDPASRSEFRKMLNGAVLRKAVDRIATMVINAVDDDYLIPFMAALGYPVPPDAAGVAAMLPPVGKGKKSFGEQVAAYFDLTMFEAYKVINVAIGAGLITETKKQNTSFLSRPGSDGIDWLSLVKGGRGGGADVVDGLMALKDCSKSRAYQLIEAAVKAGVLGEERKGREKTLWVRDIHAASSPSVTETEPLEPCPEKPPRVFIKWNDDIWEDPERPYEWTNDEQKARAWAEWNRRGRPGENPQR